MRPQQMKLFLVDGTPGGLITAEITNWTGHVLRAPLGPRSPAHEILAAERLLASRQIALADGPTTSLPTWFQGAEL